MIRLRWPWLALRNICAVLSIASQAACSPPWTIRPLSAESEPHFDAVAYVDSIWSEKVVPEATRAAIDLRSMIAEAAPASASTSRQQPRHAFVSGTGVITQVDRRSRVGLASIDLNPADGRPDAAIQVGPVIRGTAVRDALPFIRFTDFANQIDFAGVASALNDRVLSTVVAGVAVADLEGKTVVFHAAMTSTGSPSARPELVPIVLRIEETVR